jgi:ubiquinone/menaquinone biosynthesis C-methylase UbiE
LIATAGRDRSVLALEVDESQHGLNRGIGDLPNVRLEPGGAQAIPAADASFDAVIMFKSLHHVPVGLAPAALRSPFATSPSSRSSCSA